VCVLYFTALRVPRNVRHNTWEYQQPTSVTYAFLLIKSPLKVFPVLHDIFQLNQLVFLRIFIGIATYFQIFWLLFHPHTLVPFSLHTILAVLHD